jgi:membrane-associated protease RseP (regulator of RpoE activity)
MRLVLILFMSLIAAGVAAQPAPSRPLLGVTTTDLPPNVPVRGAWVREVRPGSAASDAGVQPNDVIVAVDGHRVAAAAVLTAYIGARAAGTTVTLQILRPNGNSADQLKLTALLGGTPVAQPAAGPAPTTAPQAENATAAAPGPEDANEWTDFTDPAEQAFSTEVPQGWRVEGGTVRHSSISAVPFLRLLSPDRRTYLIVGDPSITFSTTPTRFQVAQGVRDGQPAGGGGITIRRYLTGVAFARDYGPVREQSNRAAII